MTKFFQKFKILPVVVLCLGFFPALAGATALGDFRRDILLYREGVECVQQYGPTSHFFLESMKMEAEYLAAFTREVPPKPEALGKRLADFSRFRNLGKTLEEGSAGSGEFSARQEEELLWGLLVEPYLEDPFMRRLVYERALLARREYDLDFNASANFIEKPINDHVEFLQYRNEPKWYRQHGVPRFEANVGLEPFVLIEDGNPLGLMVDVGLLYHLFPEVRQRENNRFLAEAHYEGWWDRQLTRHLRKVGFRLGAGALFDGPTPAFGVGLRLRSLTLWGVYSSGDTGYSLAIGFSDFEWLKKINFVAPI